MAHDLRMLLTGTGIPPPFVLVGHSLGGLVARMFISLYPGEVAALALIDSSHPQQSWRLPKTFLEDYLGGKLATVALSYAQPIALRVRTGVLPCGEPTGERAVSGFFHGRRAGAKELFAFAGICRDTAMAAKRLGDLPLAVITASERDPGLSRPSRPARPRPFLPGVGGAASRTGGPLSEQHTRGSSERRAPRSLRRSRARHPGCR